MTNRYNLSPLIIRPMEAPVRPEDGRFRVTELIDSPTVRKLKQIHWDELVWDWSEFLEADMGTGYHARMECNRDDDTLVEHHMETTCGQYALHGTCDCIQGDTIYDHKSAKVGYLQLHFDGITCQTNLYALMARREGRTINHLVGLIRLKNWDWKMIAFGSGPNDYPPIAFESAVLPLWSEAQQTQFLEERIALHTAKDLVPCTPAERWQTSASYAVMSGSQARAKRILETREDAERHIQENRIKDAWVQERPGCALRCLRWPDGRSFCPVRAVCPFVDFVGKGPSYV